jgi:hypothetical protein
MADDNVEIKETPEPEVVVSVEPEATVPVVGEVKDPAVRDLVDQYKELEAKAAKAEENAKARDEANARAAASANEAAAARREAETAKAQATSSNLDTITTALASTQSEIETATRDIESYGQAGDFKAQAEAYARLSKATNLAARYDEAKADLEARRTQQPSPPPHITPTDPVEAYVQNRSPQTAEWLRAHRDFVINPAKNQKLTAAHYDAMAESLTPDTPEYFAHVEKFVGLKKDASVTEGDNVQRPGAAPKKQAQRAVAPVGGSSANGGAPPSNEVRLSSGEAKAATDGTHIWNYDDPSGAKKFKKGDPIGIQEFARRKQKLTQQGAYDRTYETQ